MPVPNPIEVAALPAESVTRLLGKVPTFSSDKESRCSFPAWAKLFEEHARFRFLISISDFCGVLEAQWAGLAKTNLAGTVRERWVQDISTLTSGEARDWKVFKSSLPFSPMQTSMTRPSKPTPSFSRGAAMCTLAWGCGSMGASSTRVGGHGRGSCSHRGRRNPRVLHGPAL